MRRPSIGYLTHWTIWRTHSNPKDIWLVEPSLRLTGVYFRPYLDLTLFIMDFLNAINDTYMNIRTSGILH